MSSVTVSQRSKVTFQQQKITARYNVCILFDRAKKGNLWQVWPGGSQTGDPAWSEHHWGMVVEICLPRETRENIYAVLWRRQSVCRWERRLGPPPAAQSTVCCICLPDFQTCDLPPQASNLQPGVVKTQDPQIERDLHVSLEDLYLGCTKKMKISCRVGGELCDPSTRPAEERWRHAPKMRLFSSSTGSECRWIFIQYQGQNLNNKCETWMERRHKSHLPQWRRSGENQKPANRTDLQCTVQPSRNYDFIVK